MDFPYGWTFAVLCLFQGLLVAVGWRRPWHLGASRLIGVLLPVVILAGGVVLLRTGDGPEAIALAATYATPVAALLSGVLTGWQPWLPVAAAPVCFVVAWRADGLIADAAAVALIGGACLACAALIAAAAPARAIAAGLVILAVVDAILVFRGDVAPATAALHAVTPPSLGDHPLPALQDATLGGSLFGWLDLLAPALAGMLFVADDPRRRRAAVLTGAAALLWGLMLAVSDQIPGTVPALAAVAVWLAVEPPRTQPRMRVREVTIRPSASGLR